MNSANAKFKLFLSLLLCSYGIYGQCYLTYPEGNSDEIGLTLKHEDSIVQSKFEWTVKTLNKFTRLNATVGFYDDKDKINAFALKKGIQSDGQEIYIGKNLLKRIYGNENLDNYLYPTIILGHEFGHLLQYNARWNIRGAKYKELQADFFAGFLSAMMTMHYNPDSTEEESSEKSLNLVNLAVEIFGDLGDTNFGSIEHHGTSDERVKAFIYGYVLWDTMFTLMAQKKLPLYFSEEELSRYYNWSTEYIFIAKAFPDYDFFKDFERISKEIKDIPEKDNDIDRKKNFEQFEEIFFGLDND